MLDFKAAIFDLDGTLIDSFKAWEHAYRKALAAVNHRMTDAEFIELYHMTGEESGGFFRGIYESKPNESVAARTSFESFADGILRDIWDEMVEQYALNAHGKPGALGYVKSLRERGVSLCVATLTPSKLAEPVLARIGFLPFLDFVITSDDVGLSKKFPDIYLEAAKRLGREPGETAVFEDCPTAMQTAKKAGFIVYGVVDSHRGINLADFASCYDWSVASFEDLPG